MLLRDLAAEGQANPGAFVGAPPMQALEHLEDPFRVLLLEPDPVILHRQAEPGGGASEAGPVLSLPSWGSSMAEMVTTGGTSG
jgi:hypothetical protein